jgi:hypothetical protein
MLPIATVLIVLLYQCDHFVIKMVSILNKTQYNYYINTHQRFKVIYNKKP